MSAMAELGCSGAMRMKSALSTLFSASAANEFLTKVSDQVSVVSVYKVIKFIDMVENSYQINIFLLLTVFWWSTSEKLESRNTRMENMLWTVRSHGFQVLPKTEVNHAAKREKRSGGEEKIKPLFRRRSACKPNPRPESFYRVYQKSSRDINL